MDKNCTDDDMMSTSDNDIDLTVVHGKTHERSGTTGPRDSSRLASDEVGLISQSMKTVFDKGEGKTGVECVSLRDRSVG